MYPYTKRVFDIAFSVIILILMSPLLVAVAISIKIDSPGPVFFRQERVGIHKEPFVIYKFRTMSVDSPENIPTSMLIRPEQHITRVGKFIRKRSIDELPQLFNILKGEMSIVGPRPIIFAEVKLIEERERLGVYNVLPGVTGLAQINGRDLIGLYEKAQLDSEYARKQSFLYDVKILLSTVAYVLKMDDVVEGVMNLPDLTDDFEASEEVESVEQAEVEEEQTESSSSAEIFTPFKSIEFYNKVKLLESSELIERRKTVNSTEPIEWVKQMDKKEKAE